MGLKLPGRSGLDAENRRQRAEKVYGKRKKKASIKSVLPKKSSSKSSKEQYQCFCALDDYLLCYRSLYEWQFQH